MEEQGCWLKTAVEGQTLTIRAGGEWTVERAGQLDELVGEFRMDGVRVVCLDVSSLTASETFERKVRAETNSMHAIIGAFDASLGKVLKAIVVWTLKKGEEHKSQRLRNKAK